MSKKAQTTIEVEIHGTTYNVRGGQDPEHLRQLADYVDQRMSEVASMTSTISTTKVAVLAALNIAEELFRSRSGRDETKDDLTERMTNLAGELEQVLDA